jgi:hypothetical protein
MLGADPQAELPWAAVEVQNARERYPHVTEIAWNVNAPIEEAISNSLPVYPIPTEVAASNSLANSPVPISLD